ncbi:MAG: hypothetical protein ACREV5_16530 [Steroidobacter sp.]
MILNDERASELHQRYGLSPRILRIFAYPFFLLHLLLFGGVGF